MPLTDVKVRNPKPGEKQVKLSDSGGMYLLVTPNGGKCWRLKYRFSGKEKVLGIGTYPEISLAEAREKRDAARKLLANGIDPGEAKKAQKAATIAKTENSFEVVSREWHSKFSAHGHLPTPRLFLTVLSGMFSRGWGHPLWGKLKPRTCWPFCAGWNHEGHSKRLTGSRPFAGRFSAMLWPPGALSVTRPPT